MYHHQEQLAAEILFHERGKQWNAPKPHGISWLWQTPDPALAHYFPIDASEFHEISKHG